MPNKLILNVLAVALAASFAGSAIAQDPNPGAAPPFDRTLPTPPVNPEAARNPMQDKDYSNLTPQAFLAKAIKSGRMEVEGARTAQQRASDPRVREFAQVIERDHTQLNGRLEAVHPRGDDSRPVMGSRQLTDMAHEGMAHEDMRPADDMGRKAKKGDMDKLMSLQGAEFDREYVAMQVKMHEKSIAMYEAASTQGDNTEVQALARDALPTLRRHAEQARSLHASLTGN